MGLGERSGKRRTTRIRSRRRRSAFSPSLPHLLLLKPDSQTQTTTSTRPRKKITAASAPLGSPVLHQHRVSLSLLSPPPPLPVSAPRRPPLLPSLAGQPRSVLSPPLRASQQQQGRASSPPIIDVERRARRCRAQAGDQLPYLPLPQPPSAPHPPAASQQTEDQPSRAGSKLEAAGAVVTYVWPAQHRRRGWASAGEGERGVIRAMGV